MGQVVQLKQEENTVSKWLNQFPSKDTIRTYINKVETFFNCDYNFITNNKIKSINLDYIQKFFDKLKSEGKSDNTILLYKSALSSLYEYCIDMEIIDENKNLFNTRRIKKMIGFKLTKGDEIKGVALSKEEIKKLMSCVKLERDRVLLNLLFRTGMRLHEVIKVQWNNFKIIEGKWTLEVLGKGNKKRYITIGDTMINELKEYGKWKGELGVDDKKIFDMSESNVGKLLDKYCKLSGVKKISAHDTRRSCATNLLRDGVNVVAVQKLMGHAKLEQTMRYERELDLINNNAGDYVDW